MIRTNVEVVTPACAAAYLTTNTKKQRKLNKGQVAFYARMMSEGQWQLNGEAVVFDKNGALVNGQHRLAACIQANVPFETVVVRDVEENTFYTFDSGYKRSKDQVFTIANVPNAHDVCSIISTYLRMKRSPSITSLQTAHNGVSNSDRKLCADDLLKVYNEDPQYWQDLCNLVKCMYSRCALLMRSETGGIFAYLNKVKGYDWDCVSNFFEQIFYEERTELDVLRKLRKKLIDDRMGTVKMVQLYRTQLLVKAWDCYKNGKSPRTLSWNKNTEEARFFE